jgi:hypothetical protein
MPPVYALRLFVAPESQHETPVGAPKKIQKEGTPGFKEVQTFRSTRSKRVNTAKVEPMAEQDAQEGRHFSSLRNIV